ncbi:hypothetical protein OG802_12725 [Streptomyces sp. NBC_00704]|uniref:toxin-antitoxin system YwqK family antitoxin n=1 Tax=Streptomyces sp. NBC_00704 TaxID=2975809 RepID=UPI002E3733DC|nr:hypothetical protein [Streptomyces sp. NBC_00704]
MNQSAAPHDTDAQEVDKGKSAVHEISNAARRVAIEDPEVDMDDAQRLLYRGELFTGEVTEYLGDKLVSLDEYVDGVQHGPSLEWYKDGTLRSESMVRKGLACGESKEWNSNGTLASLRVFDDDGLTLRESYEWDEDGRPTKSWRMDDGSEEP